MKKSSPKPGEPASKLIDARIKELGDWRGKTLSRLRALIKVAVKLTFAKGAAVKDPTKLFNSSLEGNTRRAIDFHEGEDINETAFKNLIRAAVNLNKSKA